MNPIMTAVRAGWSRGLIEVRQSLTNRGDLFSHFFWPAVMVVTLYFMRGVHFHKSGFTLGTLVMPSILGMNASFAMVTMSQLLTADREDGTLLRCKAAPNGMVGFLVGRIISVSVSLVIDLAIFLIPSLFIVSGFVTGSVASWLTLVWVLALGLVATLPIGAVLGSVVSSARGQTLITLPILAVIAISGIFYPITSLPHWLQWVGQSLPIYWLGLGMRSALLPNSAVSIEIGHSWRHLETIGVLGGWAVIGLILAPIVLRRMARRESGSRVTQRREKALQRTA